MVVIVVLGAVLALIVLGSIVGARRNTPPPFHDPDVETDKARVYYQGNGNMGMGGPG
jgi:hypothetical protein